MKEPECKRCRHYVQNSSSVRGGICMRFPPVPVACVNFPRPHLDSVWPEVAPCDHCGEFEARRRVAKEVAA